MTQTEDLTGRIFGRWTVLGRSDDRRGHWHCRCECGKEKDVLGWKLKVGRSMSCGCMQRDMQIEKAKQGLIHHGKRGDACGDGHKRLYHIWYDILKRCEKADYVDYPEYGGRGITVCDEWHEYKVFREWAYTSGYDEQQKLTIDRINVNRGYSPANCRWASVAEQNGNKRTCVMITYHNKTQCMAAWARELGIAYNTLRELYRRHGLSMEQILERLNLVYPLQQVS